MPSPMHQHKCCHTRLLFRLYGRERPSKIVKKDTISPESRRTMVSTSCSTTSFKGCSNNKVKKLLVSIGPSIRQEVYLRTLKNTSFCCISFRFCQILFRFLKKRQQGETSLHVGNKVTRKEKGYAAECACFLYFTSKMLRIQLGFCRLTNMSVATPKGVDRDSTIA